MVAVNDKDCKQTDALAAIVLTGGQSRRMGREKHLLPFGNEALVQRICRLLSRVAAPIAVVAAPAQQLPGLPDSVLIVRDEFPGEGPLGGIITGMAALEKSCRPRVEAAWVCSCDAPFVSADVIQLLSSKLADFKAVVIRHDEHVIPLGAVYRTSLEPQLREQFTNGERRVGAISQIARTCEVDSGMLRCVDPDLLCLWNLNTVQGYEAALAREGYGEDNFA